MKLTYAPGAALVTGGSGGIGAAVTRTLALSGLPVAATYHSRAGVVEEIARAHPEARISAYAWGSTSSSDAAALVARVAADLGPLRFVVACAGIAQRSTA
jgi:NAD(P)-dependent dehydrogenase (short-subunit alcohol dehydrogenase family)